MGGNGNPKGTMDENEHLPTPALSGSGSRVEAGFGPLSATSSPDVLPMVTFKAAFVKGLGASQNRRKGTGRASRNIQRGEIVKKLALLALLCRQKGSVLLFPQHPHQRGPAPTPGSRRDLLSLIPATGTNSPASSTLPETNSPSSLPSLAAQHGARSARYAQRSC